MEQRLIDADALLLKFIAEFCGYGTCLSSTGQIAVRLLIDDAPTIEARPVVHGRWVSIGADKRGRGGIWKCTACNKSYPHKCDFCPNCGAKMDGGDGNGGADSKD